MCSEKNWNYLLHGDGYGHKVQLQVFEHLHIHACQMPCKKEEKTKNLGRVWKSLHTILII